MSDQDKDMGRLSSREEWRYAKIALAWHGWGSPVGLGAFVLCLAVASVLVRIAVNGF